MSRNCGSWARFWIATGKRKGSICLSLGNMGVVVRVQNPRSDGCSEGGEEGFSDALDQFERQTVASHLMRFFDQRTELNVAERQELFFFSGEFDADRASPHVFVAVPVLHGNNFSERSCEHLVQFLFSASCQAVCDMFC